MRKEKKFWVRLGFISLLAIALIFIIFTSIGIHPSLKASDGSLSSNAQKLFLLAQYLTVLWSVVLVYKIIDGELKIPEIILNSLVLFLILPLVGSFFGGLYGFVTGFFKSKALMPYYAFSAGAWAGYGSVFISYGCFIWAFMEYESEDTNINCADDLYGNFAVFALNSLFGEGGSGEQPDPIVDDDFQPGDDTAGPLEEPLHPHPEMREIINTGLPSDIARLLVEKKERDRGLL